MDKSYYNFTFKNVMNKRPTGLNGHPSIRNSVLTFLSESLKFTYLHVHINKPIIE